MSKPLSFGNLDYEIVSSMEKAGSSVVTEHPFRILVMGDFSGRASRGGIREPDSGLAKGRLHHVDRDDLDGAMAQLRVSLKLPLEGDEGATVVLRFAELDDFHPDRIHANLELFTDMGGGTGSPGGVRATAIAPPPDRSSPEREVQTPLPLDNLTAANLLDDIIAAAPGATAQRPDAERKPAWDVFLEQITEPHLVPEEDRNRALLRNEVGRLTSEMMRAILHFPAFQDLEAAWRGLHLLVSRIDTGEDVQLYLLDCTREEFAADLTSSENLADTSFFALLQGTRDGVAAGEPWSMVTGSYYFGFDSEDAELLGRVAKIAAATGVPFISAARESLLGCASLANDPDPDDWTPLTDTPATLAWEELRHLPASAFVGLVLPRFLLRLPYGASTEPIESFCFEEVDDSFAHGDYLWGNPALVAVLLLAQARCEHGQEFRPGLIRDLDGLPLHIVRKTGSAEITPCAEVVLSERAAEEIMAHGLMPLLTLKDRDTVRLVRFQAISDPPVSLAGPWDK
jgi:type VI secretion system protein ImpC